MKSGSTFLLAARQCEIAELRQLARTCELVAVIARLIHALQRERGISNIFLGSQGARFAAQREQQVGQCVEMERGVRAQLERLKTDPDQVRNGARLFSRIALVLYGLDDLPVLRADIAQREVTASDATAVFGKLIAGLLAIVFEAADSAGDPEISRALVAMFNFMQGKEFAGQERTFGGRVFAAGFIDRAGQQQWRHLVESQRACFETFAAFCARALRRAEASMRDAGIDQEIEQLRRVGGRVGGELDPELSDRWCHVCTSRIDVMKALEDMATSHLRDLCERRIAQAQTELRDQRALLQALASQAQADTGGPAALGPHLERSVLMLLQEQSRRLQTMDDELDAVRATLQERKVVERAKGVIMANHRMSEDEAYKALRETAMNQKRRLVDVAQSVLALADVLPANR
ncbi:MAG TPA: nitrate- and nitrite sensing domain-containing protein [Ramlibacter sp.]|nr:nitrate- and nitrite sensing domain-containing protein [Ramlibacter sp.]